MSYSQFVGVSLSKNNNKYSVLTHLCRVAETENHTENDVKCFVMSDEHKVTNDPRQTEHHSQRETTQNLLLHRSGS